MEDDQRGTADLLGLDFEIAIAFDPVRAGLVAFPPERFEHAFGAFHLLDGRSK